MVSKKGCMISTMGKGSERGDPEKVRHIIKCSLFSLWHHNCGRPPWLWRHPIKVVVWCPSHHPIPSQSYDDMDLKST